MAQIEDSTGMFWLTVDEWNALMEMFQRQTRLLSPAEMQWMNMLADRNNSRLRAAQEAPSNLQVTASAQDHASGTLSELQAEQQALGQEAQRRLSEAIERANKEPSPHGDATEEMPVSRNGKSQHTGGTGRGGR